jgi:16S rRNA (guanine527-N7)-methyltransferase
MQNALSRGLGQLGLSLGQPTREKLCAFGQAVIEQNKVMNLTAITEPAQVAILHLADCVSLLKVADLKGKKLIDVGCGAGFPGVPLKIACPEMDLTLLDSLGKRMHWLEEILPTLGVEASYIIGRAEEALEGRREQYDFATSRAVARLNILLELTAPYVKVGGKVLAMKGAAAEEELLEAKGAIKKLGLQLEGVHTFPLDGTAHNVMVFRKVSSTPSQYPRRYSKIKQSPL